MSQLWLLVNKMLIIIIIRLLLTFTTCRLTLFIYTAVMIGTVTRSFFLLYYFHFITLLKIDHRKREREKREKWMTERVKNANQVKSICIRCGTFACVYRKIEFIWTDNVVSREIWSIFKQYTYGIDAYLYAYIKVMFSHTIQQWHPWLRAISHFSFSLHVRIG